MAAPILILAAWPPELTALRRHRRRRSHQAAAPVVLDTVGVGLVEAAIGATASIEKHRPQKLVLIGTAGVFPAARAAHPIGSVAVATTIHLASQAVVEKSAYLPSTLPARLDTHRGLTRAIQRISDAPDATVLCPLGITRTTRLARQRQRNPGAQLENLEAFAIARAAARARIPFTAVLGISNIVGPQGHTQWQANAAAAAARANRAVAAWLQSN